MLRIPCREGWSEQLSERFDKANRDQDNIPNINSLNNLKKSAS